jgi:hypothetical protein
MIVVGSGAGFLRNNVFRGHTDQQTSAENFEEVAATEIENVLQGRGLLLAQFRCDFG